MKLNILCIFLFLISSQLVIAKLHPLNFDPEKNGVKILPQRFEYQIIDDDRVKIGDSLVDFNYLSFVIENVEGSNIIKLRWPSSFLQFGRAIIKDSSGKAIIEQEINPSKIKTYRPRLIKKLDHLKLRTDVSEVVLDDIDANIIEEMKYQPVISFCFFRKDQSTKIYLCSKELYLVPNGSSYIVKSHPIKSGTSLVVEVNGLKVGNQGMIFLNSEKEDLHLNVRAKSTASLEIETRKNNIEFTDVIKQTKGEKVIITGRGAKPINGSKYKLISKDEWRFLLSSDEPFLYLKGAGDIPMRQEIYTKSNLPTADDRIYTNSNIETTYSSSITITGPYSPEKGLLSAEAKNDELKLKDKSFEWTINNIPSGETSKHFLTLQKSNTSHYVYYKINRGYQNYFEINSGYWTNSSQLQIEALYKLFLSTSFNLNFNYINMPSSSTQSLSITDTRIGLGINLISGLFLSENILGVNLNIDSISVSSVSGSTTSYDLFWRNDQHKVQFSYFTSLTSSTLNLDAYYMAHYQYQYKWSKFITSPFKIAYSNFNNLSNTQLNLGIGFLF